MYAHRIEIFDRADDDDVVGAVAHHLEFEFLPAFDRLLDQHLMAGRHVEAECHLGAEILGLARDRTSGATQSARGPNDQRKRETRANFLSLLDRSSDAGGWHLEADLD